MVLLHAVREKQLRIEFLHYTVTKKCKRADHKKKIIQPKRLDINFADASIYLYLHLYYSWYSFLVQEYNLKKGFVNLKFTIKKKS